MMFNKLTKSIFISINEMLKIYSNISKKLFVIKFFAVFNLISSVIFSLEKWDIYALIIFC